MTELERMERLRAFGLSEYAARAYLALLALGTTEARDVSRRAKIPHAKVYGVLDHLQARGLASIEPTTPKRFSPVQFEEFLDKLRERHLQEVRELDTARADLGRMFAPPPGTPHYGDRGGVRLLKGRREVLQMHRTLLAKSQTGVLIAPPLGWTARNVHARAVLDDAHARGVGIRLLVHEGASFRSALDEFRHVADMRERGFTLPGAETVETALYDGRVALITHFIPDDASTQRGDDVGILIEQAGIVRGLECHLEARWRAATPIPLAWPRDL